MKLKAFLFDYDETVVYSNMDHVRSYIEAGKKFGLKITKKQIHERMGKSAINIISELFPELTDEEIIKLRDEKEKIYRKTISKKDVKTVVGLVELLEFLRKNKIKCGIVSSASIRNIRIGLKENGIEKYFKAIAAAENVKRHKPNPDPVLKVARMLGVGTKNCVLIGDSIYDIIAAKRAHVLALGLTTGYYSEMELRIHGAKFSFRNHFEVLSFLRSGRTLEL